MQHVFNTEDEYLKGLSTFVIDTYKKSVEEHGCFYVALSGGSAATLLAKSLQSDSGDMDFSKWKIFFCDERYVPLNDADSNFKGIHDNLFLKVPVTRENIVVMAMCESVEEAAADYEAKLRKSFDVSAPDIPRFDLLVLGMGPDGHTCSLFPDHELLDEKEKLVRSISASPKPPPQRITFTLPLVNNARKAVFITTGKGKAENIRKALKEQPSRSLPASLVQLTDGEVHWFMDKDAASLL